MDPSQIPENFAVFLMDDSPVPKVGARAGPEYDFLVYSLAHLCRASLSGNSELLHIVKTNPALQILGNNNPLFSVLKTAYLAGSTEKVKSTYASFNEMAENIIQLFQQDMSASRDQRIHQYGVDAYDLAGNEGIRALFQHVLALATIHYGFHGNGENLAEIWKDIGKWRY